MFRGSFFRDSGFLREGLELFPSSDVLWHPSVSVHLDSPFPRLLHTAVGFRRCLDFRLTCF